MDLPTTLKKQVPFFDFNENMKRSKAAITRQIKEFVSMNMEHMCDCKSLWFYIMNYFNHGRKSLNEFDLTFLMIHFTRGLYYDPEILNWCYIHLDVSNTLLYRILWEKLNMITSKYKSHSGAVVTIKFQQLFSEWPCLWEQRLIKKTMGPYC